MDRSGIVQNVQVMYNGGRYDFDRKQKNLCRNVTNSVDRGAKSEYSFGKLLNSVRVLSAKRFGMELKMRKTGKRIAVIALILILILVVYVIYVFAVYDRLPDKLALEVYRVETGTDDGNGMDDAMTIEDSTSWDEGIYSAGQNYSILTYNIGFGAYLPEYSFFMDGGKSSWGKDEDSVAAAVCGAGTLMRDTDADFMLIQEVDRDGTWSYHIDELELLNQFTEGYYYTYAQNYDSPFLFFPPWEPHGANKAGVVTYSRGAITEAMRRSLPISESLSKFVDLDRCYSISRIPLGELGSGTQPESAAASAEDGRMLCLYNMHMSAYGSSDEIRAGQLAMLYEDMMADRQKGNYVICGGDFNHDLKTENSRNAPEWAYPFPRESLPEGFRMAIDDSAAAEADIEHNTCRSAEEPYQEETTYTVTLDGFIVSDNVEVRSYRHVDTGYLYSDHDPVLMEFVLK